MTIRPSALSPLLAITALAALSLNACAPHSSAPGAEGKAAADLVNATPVFDGRVLYVATDDGVMNAYQEGTWENIGQWSGLPFTDGVRGVDADPSTGTLFISHGADTTTGPGGLLAWNLYDSTQEYDATYPHGVDQPSYGRGIVYMPTGEASTTDSHTYLIDAVTGEEVGSEPSGKRPHNTVFRNGHVYSGGMHDAYLNVQGIGAGSIGPTPASTAKYGVRPFTINADETRAYITWSGYRGFSVGDIGTGEILTSINFGPNTAGAYDGVSHGISLSPDGTELYVLDMVTNQVLVYDSSDQPALLATITLETPIYPGVESPCAATSNCAKSGWLLHSGDGQYVFVGDSGDVIDTGTRTIVANILPLQNARHGYIEINWRDGNVVGTTTHFGLGR